MFNMKIINPKTISLAAIFPVVLAVVGFLIFSAPGDFPTGKVVRIEEGLSLSQIAGKLKSAGIVKFGWPLSFIIKTFNKEKNAQFGDYIFESPISAFGVAKKIIGGGFGVDKIKVTVPEGSTLKDIAEIFGSFENFNKDDFLTTAENLEGYFFPDTYFFSPYADTGEIIKEMKDNFKNKAGDIDRKVVIMASLIEKEAANKSDRRIISGILWKRLDIGMPLQVDAIFPYIIGKKSSELTLEDLKIDSPYNTYLYKGLPPRPIGNPGLGAIEAALNPVDSSYFYYLSDKEGNTHYAASFEEHKINKRKYLLN